MNQDSVSSAESAIAEGPLAGILVVDLSRALAGPHATMVLADLGARVIKVEPPQGDDTRRWGPPFAGSAEQPVSTYYLAANRNKESIQLNLKNQGDLDLLKELVRRADVLVENYRPGVLDRLGLGTAVLGELNPRLVVLSITGFGHDGPEGTRAGYDQIAQGEAGLMSVTGTDADHPTRIGVPIGDLLAGLNGAIGITSALVGRQLTGRGTVVRTSLLAAVVGAHAFHGTNWTVTGKVAQPTGNHHPTIAPYGAFRCSDGFVQIAVGSDSLWQKFAALVGLDPDEARYADNPSRMQHQADLTEHIEARLREQPRAHWLPMFAEAGIPAGAIRTIDEVYTWDQTRSQGLVIGVEHPTIGPIDLPGPSLRLETLAGERAGRTSHDAPPTLGQHTESVREWLNGSASSTVNGTAG